MSANSTADSRIISTEEFDLSNLTATEPKKKNDRLQSYLLYNSSTFYIETNFGRAPFGVKAFEGGDKTDYSLNISLEHDDKLIQSLTDLDEYMIDFAVEHSLIIFKKKYTSAQREVVRAMYTSSVKKSEGGDYPLALLRKSRKRVLRTSRLVFCSTILKRKRLKLNHSPSWKNLFQRVPE